MKHKMHTYTFNSCNVSLKVWSKSTRRSPIGKECCSLPWQSNAADGKNNTGKKNGNLFRLLNYTWFCSNWLLPFSIASMMACLSILTKHYILYKEKFGIKNFFFIIDNFMKQFLVERIMVIEKQLITVKYTWLSRSYNLLLTMQTT